MRTWIASLSLSLSLFGAGCGNALTNGDGPAPPDMTQTVDQAQAPDLSQVMSGIGVACTGGGQDQGTCADGQICITDGDGYPDGYCSEDCTNAMCPSDASCVTLMGLGVALCFKSCTTTADCRASEGYHCSMRSHTCQPNGGMNNNGGGVTPGTADGGACVTPIVNPGQGLAGPFGSNVRVSPGQLEAETWLAVDPTGQDVLVAYNDLASNGPLGSAASTNGGMAWGPNQAVPPDMTVDKQLLASDPVVAIDSLGHFWVSWVGYSPSGGGNVQDMHVYVARSSDNGATFDQVVEASPPGEWVAGGFIDKPWLDIGADDTMYVTWSRATANLVDIRIARSTDHGMTWKTLTVSDSGVRPQLDRNLAMSAIDTNGRVVTTWVEITSQQFGATDNFVYAQAFNSDFTKSGANVRVTKNTDSPAFEDPSIAIDGMNVYVGYISGSPNGDWDVRVATSLDAGATFGASVKANDDRTCATHFHHQIAVDPTGNVHAIWYDNRFLTGNVFYAKSPPADMMNPLAFGQNVFVNDAPLTFTTRRDQQNWLGDYLALLATPTGLYAAWSDNRLNNTSHIFFAKAPPQ